MSPRRLVDVWPEVATNLRESPDGGLFAADLDRDGNIVYVEILHRDDVKARYRELQGT
jgi:hypothetical protein